VTHYTFHHVTGVDPSAPSLLIVLAGYPPPLLGGRTDWRCRQRETASWRLSAKPECVWRTRLRGQAPMMYLPCKLHASPVLTTWTFQVQSRTRMNGMNGFAV
jgi:hypothetical protein